MQRIVFSLLILVLVFPISLTAQEEVTIYEIQQGGYTGQEIITTGVVTADHTVFTDDEYEYAVIEDPQGGAYSGIVLFSISQGELTCDEGDEVRVQGTVQEYYDLTEISYITSFEKIGTADVPDAEVLTTVDLSTSNPGEAEKWEGVLVTVYDAEVTNDDLGYGEFEINDGSGAARVDDWGGYESKPYEYDPVLGEVIDVRGILWYSHENFKIEPRGDQDIPEVGTKVNVMSWGQLKASIQ